MYVLPTVLCSVTFSGHFSESVVQDSNFEKYSAQRAALKQTKYHLNLKTGNHTRINIFKEYNFN